MTRRIEYVCPFVPAELISAWGFTPCRKKLSGQTATETTENSLAQHHNLSAGVCPVAESAIFEFSQTQSAGVIFSTTCDQLRRAKEIFTSHRPDVPAFLLNVPASWQDPTCLAYYRCELERLGKFLHQLGGTTPDEQKFSDIIRTGALRRKNASQSQNDNNTSIKLAIVGSELRGEDDWIFTYINELGGIVALDATFNSEMLTPPTAIPACVDSDPLGALAEMYFYMPHPFRRPDSQFFDYVALNAASRKISGVIMLRMSWCDTAHGFARRLKQKLAMPFIEISESDRSDAKAHIQNRLSAFMEMLK